MKKEISNIQLSYLNINDYSGLKEEMISAYHAIDNAYLALEKIEWLIDIFPEGQVVIKVNDEYKLKTNKKRDCLDKHADNEYHVYVD